MDVIKSSSKNGKHYVTDKTIGGIIDFRFFGGQRSPRLAIEKLSFYSGKSAIPPFWSLGFHQCRYGYHNITYLEDVVTNY